ncbi:sulfatase [Runella zeae]|uniref:sulfatase n=1 Tax=Runella zeae TaxID=94255 RepID=UPI00056117FB|nr:sulfatase [Runella zeae]
MIKFKLISTFTIVALLLHGNFAQTQTTKPNIIFILADDLAQADLGCYGNPFNETPNLDKLAKSGIKFTQSYAACPVCSPSRAAIMTGKHPARLKLTNFLVGERTDSLSPVKPAQWTKYLGSSEITLAERLKPLGYRTGFVGKWHLGGADSLAPWGQGFTYARMIGKNGLDYYNYSIYEDSYKKMFEDKGTTYLTDKLTDYALDFVKSSDKQQPFFLYLCYSAPHVFLVPRGDKVSKYLKKFEKFNGKYNPYYAAVIESMDDGVGQIIQLLEEKGLMENTLIVFTSDNGGVGIPELGPIPTTAGNLRKWKGFTYEGGIRVPTLISQRGTIAANQICDQYFMNTDYTPTLLDILGQKQEVMPDAKSFLPLLKNPEANFDRGQIFWHYPHFSNQLSRPSGAIREGDWKLTKSYETNEIALFNLRDDESETEDLSKNNPSKAQEMHRKLTDWLKKVDANMPIMK